MTIFNRPIEQIYKELNTSKNGLTSQKAQDNAKYGQNVLDKEHKTNFFIRFLLQFKNLMIIVLLISAIVSICVSIISKEYSDIFEGILIFIIVIINSIIGVFQERRAENAIALLNKKTEPFAKVLRDGKIIKIPHSQVVIGDIVKIKAGDYIPADIRLIEANNLKCDESTLTGESHEAFKNSETFLKDNTPIAEQETMCFSGTCCTYGNATGIVVNVGKQTEMGKIAKLLTNKVKEKTPLEKNIDKIGKFITISVIIIVAIVFVVELIFATNRSFLDSFLIAIALAVAAIPESLPAVITIVMALGVERLAKKQAIVKTLSSVETLGCCSVIASDKTGTLTQNKMTLKHVFCNNKILEASDIKTEDYDTFIKAICLCNNAEQSQDKIIVGDATETSLLNFLIDKNIDIDNIRKRNNRLSEIPFDSNRKIMSTINTTSDGIYMFSKGAYDYLINKCEYILINGQIKTLTFSQKQEIDKAISTLASKAERIIAVAQKKCINEQDTKEDGLIFVGLAGIIDPPKQESKLAIKQCLRAGLRPVMITGDHPETAFAIAKELHIATTKSQILTGTQIDKLSTKELSKIINDYSVFARVTPEHKVKIVKAYKKSGKVVAMTGDGVNDAPSLSHADIGTCMGLTGTDVTKSVSDLIITDDNFSTIVLAIKEGRTIYANIRKIIRFLIGTNMVEVLGIFVSTIVMKDSIFLLPSQILFINLITDSFPAFALGLEKPEKDVLNKPPRNVNTSLFSGKTGTGILYESFIQTLLVLVIFVFAVNSYGNEVASTMVFLIICIMQIIHAINCKTEESIFKTNIFNNKTFNFCFILLFVLIMLVAFVPILQTAFGIVSLNGTQWLIIALASISIIPLVELCKFLSSLHINAISLKIKK